MARDDDDLDFDALMREGGAERLGGGHAPARRPPPPQHRAVARGPGPRATTEAPAVSAPSAALEAELLAVKGRLLEATTRADAAEAERDALTTTIEGLRRDLDAAQRSRDAARTELAAAKRAVAAAPPPPETPEPTPLTDLLEARGLDSAEDQARGLALALATDSARSLMSRLDTVDPDGVTSVLTRRVALLCGGPGCEAPRDARVLEVPPERCDVCGGSDIQRAAEHFRSACLAAKLKRIRIVGGSPAYRTQLEQLFPRRGPLQVRTTEGDKRVPLSRSKAQQRSDDLVIIWASTELDHATSGAYRASEGAVLTIPIRGIGRMLERAATLIARR